METRAGRIKYVSICYPQQVNNSTEAEPNCKTAHSVEIPVIIIYCYERGSNVYAVFTVSVQQIEQEFCSDNFNGRLLTCEVTVA